MATQEDRSLSSGMSLPRWMKTKMNDKLDFEKSAFSPTELDDSFMFYYRKNSVKGSNDAAALTNTTKSLIESTKHQISAADHNGHQPDFSKHTPFCQKYLKDSTDSTAAQKVIFPSATKTKPSGVDDGFKGEAAKCGSSVIRMAHQMVAGGKVVRGFNIEQDKGCDAPPEGFNPAIRRGSRSLPASPLSSPNTSPKGSRRVLNKYFTGPFVDNENHHGSWLLSNLLGKRKNLSQSVGYIAEEEGSGDIKNAVSITSVDELASGPRKNNQVFVAKPSELREMNFWSPTSM